MHDANLVWEAVYNHYKRLMNCNEYAMQNTQKSVADFYKFKAVEKLRGK